MLHDYILQCSLFFRQPAEGGLIRFVGGQPELVPEGHLIVVRGHDFNCALAFAKITILLVIADADHHPDEAARVGLIGAKRAQCGVCHMVFKLSDLVVNIVGTLKLAELQFFLRPF